jgi:hypothetical protein
LFSWALAGKMSRITPNCTLDAVHHARAAVLLGLIAAIAQLATGEKEASDGGGSALAQVHVETVSLDYLRQIRSVL